MAPVLNFVPAASNFDMINFLFLFFPYYIKLKVKVCNTTYWLLYSMQIPCYNYTIGPSYENTSWSKETT